jgi:tRNA-splicing ligase RtcB
MFSIFDEDKQKWPIKIWLNDESSLEPECLKQAMNLANLSFIHKWVALMPDTHPGFGMPIGGVIATENVIIPNAVGVDIGCGMQFVMTNIPVAELTSTDTAEGKLTDLIVSEILRAIPTGFSHHKYKQQCEAVDQFRVQLVDEPSRQTPKALLKELDSALMQVGTLGGGNHFIELQVDDEGYLGIMVHSGSRNLGLKICNTFNALAKETNDKEFLSVPKAWNLACLDANSELGMEYIRWMNFAMEFAKENRTKMMNVVIQTIRNLIKQYVDFSDIQMSEVLDCHHNYASFEQHYDKMVWVHRKGAIQAPKGKEGIIPGAMGSYSYIVRGKGNPVSFESCSHGAGRLMSRKEAKEKFSMVSTVADLKTRGVTIGKVKKVDIGEESRLAYKDIDHVIDNERDLIETVKRLKTVAVVKG